MIVGASNLIQLMEAFSEAFQIWPISDEGVPGPLIVLSEAAFPDGREQD